MKCIFLRGTVVLLTLISLGLGNSGSVLAVQSPLSATAPAAPRLPASTGGPADRKDPAKLRGGADHTDRVIVKFKDPSLAQARVVGSGPTKALSARAGLTLSHLRNISGGNHVFKMPKRFTQDEALAIAEKLKADPEVEYAVPDRLLSPQQTPNDPSYPSQWHYKSPDSDQEIAGINLPPAWDISTGADSLVIAILDTGIVNHADLQGRIVPGYNFISEAARAGNGIGRSADASDLGDWVTIQEAGNPASPFYGCYVTHSSWHGTHVAGTVAATTNNGSGVTGINWNSKILPVRVLGRCGGYLSDVMDGMRWAAGLSVPGVPANANPARIINMSLAGEAACDTAMQETINDVTAAGALVVVAAGNGSADVADFVPAGCNGVLSVAAVNRAGGPTFYSNYGKTVKIAAPGGEQEYPNSPFGILSPANSGTTSPVASPGGDAYRFYQGTSMAAPQVTGVASLMLSLQPALTPSQVMQKLQATARPFPTGTGSNSGDCTTSRCGAGIVDAYRVLSAVGSAAPLIAATPLFLEFTTHVGDPNPPSQTITIANAGGGTLNWSVSSDVAWLQVAPTGGQENGTLTVSVDTSGLSPTTPHSGTITITAAGATYSPVTIPVSLKYLLKPHAPIPSAVSNPALAAVGGKVYVIGGAPESNYKRVQIYDTVSDTWTAGAPKPSIALEVNAAAIGGRIYVPGGYSQPGAYSDVLEIYDPETDQWSSGAPLPLPLVGAAVAAVNGKLYVMGGRNMLESAYSSTYVYDPAANSWSRMADMGTRGRESFSAEVVDGKIYVFGGDPAIPDSAQVYDPVANSWSDPAYLNSFRLWPGTAALGGKIYAFGGWRNGWLQDADSYQPGTNSWSVFPLWLNLPRYELKAVAVGNSIYVMGGIYPAAGGWARTSTMNESYTDYTLPVNGACGSSNGKSFSTVPTTGLCDSGTPSAVTGNGPWNWTCAGANGGTTANCSAASVVITTASALPDARQGNSFSVSLTATGGLSPYTWSLPSGGLPPGLLLTPATGAISGTPSLAGSYGFEVQVMDAAGGRDSKSLSLTVKLPPAMLVRDPAQYYTMIGDAYNFSADGETIKLSGVVQFYEDLRFDRDITVALHGGYNDDFTISSGMTIVNGKLSSSNGHLKLNSHIRFR